MQRPHDSGVHVAAAIAEIAGCFAFWAWLRLSKPIRWLAPGIRQSLAAYGGVDIVSSPTWLWTIKGVRPDRWDLAGAALRLAGAAITIGAIGFDPRLPQSMP